MVPCCSQFAMLSSLSSLLLLLILFIISTCSSFSSQDLPPPENPTFAQEQLLLNPFKTTLNQALTCGQLIVSRGFKYERHFATTQDGYILQLYRIINPYAQAARGRNLKPILMLHGAPTSCSSFMINGSGGHIKEWINGNPPPDKSKSLAFALANREFDVWLGNVRGTTYSLNHTRLNPSKDREFWDFTFKEMGEYDIPAMVDYIIQETGYEKVVYIGYSQGTIAMLTLLAKYPEFSFKLDLNINVAPIAFYANTRGLSSFIPRLRFLSRISSLYSGPVLPVLPALDGFASLLCTNYLLSSICFEIYNYLFGPDREMVSPKQIRELVSQLDQSSFKSALHGIQSLRFDQIREFDYGPKKNLEIYGSIEPPKYPFENIPTYNLVLISSLNDYLAPPVNIQKLRNILKGPALIDYVVTWPLWSHTDILLGDKAFQYLHSVIINIIRRYGDQVETWIGI